MNIKNIIPTRKNEPDYVVFDVIVHGLFVGNYEKLNLIRSDSFNSFLFLSKKARELYQKHF